MELNEYHDKVAGALYGFAIGDALGAPTEFMNVADIKMKYGFVSKYIGGGWLNIKPGAVTDDTQMMLCVIDAWMDTPKDANVFMFKHECARKFASWLATKPIDVGNTCAAGIRYYVNSGYHQFISKDDNALGNGALMRATPLAITCQDLWNTSQGAITHNSEGSARDIQSYSKVLKELMLGIYPTELPNDLQPPLATCGATLNNALYYLKTKDFKKAVLMAVNNGGDADTIAAITGSLMGAYVGFNAIPKYYVDNLDRCVAKKLEKAAIKLTDYCIKAKLYQ